MYIDEKLNQQTVLTLHFTLICSLVYAGRDLLLVLSYTSKNASVCKPTIHICIEKKHCTSFHTI